MAKHLFTSESVTEGHPDKVADQISDAILDAILAKDKNAHVACETVVTTGLVLVAGEITTECYVDIPKIVRKTLHDIGYNDASFGFDDKACAVLTSIDEQSPDISQGVDREDPMLQGAGDQGLMFGYATNETESYMPLPADLAQKLTRRLAEVRKNNTLSYLRPDGKSQVTVEYDNGKPIRVDTIVLSTQHSPDVELKQIKKDLMEHVIKPVAGKLIDEDTKYHINPTGRFVQGGPPADCGLTGRKIIVDTYGGWGRHGGGCFSGKDPSKVDRSGAYMARYIAKNIVASGLADRCEVQIAYAIGVAEPVSVFVDTNGTGKIADEKITELVKQNFDLKPAAIIKKLDLLRPIYSLTASYGHFGRDETELTWESTDLAETLKEAANL